MNKSSPNNSAMIRSLIIIK